MTTRFVSACAVAWLVCTFAGCSIRTNGNTGTHADPCMPDEHRCKDSTRQKCVAGYYLDDVACPAACDDTLGCVDCAPKTTFCQGDTVYQCTPEGKAGNSIVTCVAGGCISGTCTDPCGRAAAEFSYLGCDYFPTVTLNSLLTAQANFAVAIANPGDADVDVTITRLGKTIKKVTVAQGALEIVKLAWVDELRKATASGVVAGGAYKLSTTAPVTVYQFNPLEFQLQDNCTDQSCFTYTNDASLLLPTSTLTGHYLIISRPTYERETTQFGITQYAKLSGFFSVVGAEAARATVTVKFSAATLAGLNGSIKPYKRGDTDTFSVAQGDVLQILSDQPDKCTPNRNESSSDGSGNAISYGYCDMSAHDLTGTEIISDRRVAVFAGHDCTFVPYDKWACDHLEEEMLPLESWGRDYLAVHTKRSPPTIPDLWRVVSGADHNTISFDPAVQQPVTLNKGEWVEFPSTESFEAIGTGPFALAQFMVGQDWNGIGTGGTAGGDPAMGLAVPIEQYRKDYQFLAPASYKQNFINITAPAGLNIALDGNPIDVSSFSPIGAGKYVGARLSISPGTHSIAANQPFGISIYGLAPYTSYMYPGGLDVRQINVE